MIKAVLFDKDGVIINSESVNIFSAVEAFRDLGIKITEEDKEQIIGRHPIDYINHFTERYSFSVDDFMKRQKELYFQLYGSAELYKGIISLIKELKRKGFLLALTTTSGLKGTELLLKRAGLTKVFDVVTTFEDCTNRKPDPEGYLITAEKLGVDPKDCLVIEDSYVGLKAAVRAGMKCIVIPNEHTKNQDFSKADYIVGGAGEIAEKLSNDFS